MGTQAFQGRHIRILEGSGYKDARLATGETIAPPFRADQLGVAYALSFVNLF
jgi:hypothetical protein